jgi:hypothetical protein
MCRWIVEWTANNGVKIIWKEAFIIQDKADVCRFDSLRK